MKITKIEEQKNNKERYNIYVDDLFAIGIDGELKYKYKLVENMEVNDEFLNDILMAEEKNKTVNSAVRYLSFRQRSVKEVRDYLARKDFNEDFIQDAIDFCMKYNYLNDYEFAKAFTKDKVNLNKWGSDRIKYELKLKGIDSLTIGQVTEFLKEDEYSIAYGLAEKKIKSYKDDDKYKIYGKLSGFLSRRGYSYDTINSVVNDLLKDLDIKWKTMSTS